MQKYSFTRTRENKINELIYFSHENRFINYGIYNELTLLSHKKIGHLTRWLDSLFIALVKRLLRNLENALLHVALAKHRSVTILGEED